MDGNGAEAALDSFTRQMRRLPTALRKSMTYDRGSEMACHPKLARRLKIDIWFCDPHAPWQRGSNENTNGLLRQFMPKGTDLNGASQTWLNDVANLMNNRPRKTLGWRTPAVNFVPVAGHWGTLPQSVKGAPNGTTSTQLYRRL